MGPLLFGQQPKINSNELLNRSITYHDPQGTWGTYAGAFTVVSTRPDKSDRISRISMNHNLSLFRLDLDLDYYSYVYGLPMKLMDPGTRIDPQVGLRNFKGTEYLVLKATYAPETGKDTWYFYFHPKTYALKVYQFYHDESLNDGEYILLEGETEIKGMRLPKKRSWYTNKEDTLLGADTITDGTL